jgi:cyclopropane fatty-acyl-phospholipid synthase-like methyltransferase
VSLWIDFWDRPNAIYAGRRNIEAHFDCITCDLVSHLPKGGTVLDFGCGEALGAERMAQSCGRVLLFDGAPSVRQKLKERLGRQPNIDVLDGEALAAQPAGSVDLIVVVSVLQYIGRGELPGLLARWRDLLAPGGRLLLADVVVTGTPMLRDVRSQLGFAARHGFLVAALAGLVRMALSDYRQIRQQVGFSTYTPDELRAVLEKAGFTVERLERNIGPTPHRFTLVGRPPSVSAGGAGSVAVAERPEAVGAVAP